ncbi:MAG: DUF6167 family protein [Micropruina sp.]|uniref:DUF6167 family protein n=1 Tax=Micropruina sp. TaxID=2737536 RepID=UPI0039E360A5
MGRRLFWFAVGAGVTVWLVLKGREYYERFTPKGITEQVEKTAHDARGWVDDFLHTMTSAMDEREHELREALGLDGSSLPDQEGVPVQESNRT